LLFNCIGDVIMQHSDYMCSSNHIFCLGPYFMLFSLFNLEEQYPNNLVKVQNGCPSLNQIIQVDEVILPHLLFSDSFWDVPHLLQKVSFLKYSHSSHTLQLLKRCPSQGNCLDFKVKIRVKGQHHLLVV